MIRKTKVKLTSENSGIFVINPITRLSKTTRRQNKKRNFKFRSNLPVTSFSQVFKAYHNHNQPDEQPSSYPVSYYSVISCAWRNRSYLTYRYKHSASSGCMSTSIWQQLIVLVLEIVIEKSIPTELHQIWKRILQTTKRLLISLFFFYLKQLLSHLF